MKAAGATRWLTHAVERYPALAVCESDIFAAFNLLSTCFAAGGKLLLCGNGGSAADCEHIVGELMKGFVLPRPVSEDLRLRLLTAAGAETGEMLAARLQRALPAIALTGSPSLATAVANDTDATLNFAQQTLGLGREGDVLLCISTSGNSRNVVNAAHVARAQGLGVIALTGRVGGTLAGIADAAVRVPADTTPEIQEFHLPVYHALCLALEERFFGDGA